MIKKYSLTILQKAINHALALDESMPSKLQALEGKLLEIIIKPLNVNFFIHFTGAQLHLLTESENQPDTIIQSNPLGLIRLSLLPASKMRSVFNDDVSISGDIELGQRVKNLFDELEIDWEGHLSRFTGDVIAYQLGSVVRQGLAFKKQIHASMHQNLTEFLQEEIRIFPPREEINDFFNDIDELSLATERLTAHVNQLLKDAS